ncbi:POLG alternative reading frame-like [Meriones unguiculatus]|uniref:POLG alternative reading frame-like n=1 Tax=Meriones unguiculatus TaxID=10047 RepID=UPI00293EB058|nr:POLG alternative reading frame-like [Meriones unguiculatus]
MSNITSSSLPSPYSVEQQSEVFRGEQLHCRASAQWRLPIHAPATVQPPASSERSAGAGGSGGRASATQSSLRRGRPAGASIGGCVSDFALAPLRGLDVQTSPERAEREGPARGRRRQEAPPLKGAGRAPPLGRTRGRKEGAGLPAGRAGMRAAAGWAAAGGGADGLRPRRGGLRAGLPRRAGPGSQRRSGGRSRRPARAAGGESESQRRRGLCARAGAAAGPGGAGDCQHHRPAGRARRRNSAAPP